MEKRFKIKSIVGAALFFAIIAQLIHSLSAMLTMGYYTDVEYISVWSKLMMPTAGPPPASFMVYGLVFSFITGILITVGYVLLKDGLRIKNVYKRGAAFGFIIFLVSIIPGTLSMILLVNLPIVLFIVWAIENLVILVLAGILIGKLN